MLVHNKQCMVVFCLFTNFNIGLLIKMEAKKHVFSPTEKKHFLDILKKYSNILENKDTDGASLRNKNEAWIRVTNEYNASLLATKQVSDY